MSQAKYEEAEKYMRRALAIYENSPDVNNSLVATSLNNLGTLLLHLGNRKFPEAEQLFQRALTIQTHGHDAIHSDRARTLNSLAFLHRTQKNYEEIYSKVVDGT
jgi:tetratricopeptide (TPR) repeat protein